jgi:HK97 family phage portal protein
MNRKMTLSDRISSIKAAFTGLPNQSFINMAQRFMPVYGEPPKRSTEDWIELYNKSPRMNPIHQIASDVATSCYGIYNENDTKKIKIKGSNSEKILKHPNSNKTITEYALFYITQVYLMLPSGEAFWIKERNGLGKVTEIWPIPPSWVNEIPSTSKDYFTIYPLGNMQAQPIYVPPYDMVYFKKPDVNNPYLRGIGRAEGIGDEIETDEYMAKYQKRYFFNDAIPPMVGMMPGADEPTISRTEESWQQKYGGFNNKHKMAWLNWDAKFQLLKETNKDMDFIESRKYLRDVSNQHFSIPPELFGILENSNRSTIDAAYYLYTKNVLRKELKFIDDTLNIQLVPELDKSVYLEHDNVVPEDDEFKLKKASEGLKNGGILVDEWRLSNGWEALPNGKGQILYTPLNMIPTTLNGETLQTNLPPREIPPIVATINLDNKPEFNTEVTEYNIKKKMLTLEHKNQLWYILDKAATKNERSFVSASKKFFQGQQDRMNNKLLKSIKSVDDVDWDNEDDLFYATLTPLWMASLVEGFETVNVTFSFGLTQDFMQPKFTEWIKEHGLDQVKDINTTTKEKLQKTLSEGIDQGESIVKLRDRISVIFTEAKTSRTEKIAKTETHNTVGAGTHETYKAANVQRRSWLTTIDGRERESHAAINGEIREIDKPFSNGLMYPGDPSGSAKELVNCRCVELPELD